MPCCSNAKVENEQGFKPKITEGRKCTDCIFLIIFAAFWAGMILVAIVAMQAGEPAKLLYGSDHLGNTCGGSTSACGGACASKKDILYPRTNEDLMLAAQTGSVTNVQFFGICVNGCPKKDQWVCTYAGDARLTTDGFESAARTAELDRCKAKAASLGAASVFASKLLVGDPACQYYMENCWKTPQDTAATFFRCMPVVNQTTASTEQCVDPVFDNSGLAVGSAAYNTIPMPAADPRCITKRSTSVVTSEAPAQPNILFDQLNTVGALLTRYFADIQSTWNVILVVGGVAAILVGFLYLLILRYAAGCVVWVTIIVMELLLIAFTLYCFMKAGILGSAQIGAITGSVNTATASAASATASATSVATASTGINVNVNVTSAAPVVSTVTVPSFLGSAGGANQTYFAIAAYVMSGVSGIMLLMIVFLHRRISIAVGIIKEASKAVGAMPTIVLFPLLTVTLILLLAIYWLAIAAFIASSGTITPQDFASQAAGVASALNAAANGTALASVTSSVTGSVVSAINNTQVNGTGLAGANLGAAVNASNPAGSMGAVALQTFSAMSLKDYMQAYHFFGFLWTNQFIQGIGIMTIAGAIACWYWSLEKSDVPKLVVLHALKRTLVYHLGSVAFGSLIIAVIQFVRAILAYLDRKSKGAQDKNIVLKIVFKCVACCLWCFEKCMKFVSKNAYIIIAMEGHSFCRATMRAVKVIMGNAAQVGIVSFISTFIMWIGKLMICGGAGVLAFLWLDAAPPAGMNSVFFPVLVTVLLAYFVAGAFLSVYDMAIDTILLCFCLDRENNDGSPAKPYYMGDSLRKFVKTAKATADAADKAEAGGSAGNDVEKYKEEKTPAGGGGGNQEII